MSDDPKPWAFVCHKDGRFGGVTVAEPGRDTKKFVADFLADGYTVTPVFSREEWLEFSATLKKRSA